MPAQVLLFRHAEKPDAASDMGLSPRGQIRAAALAVYLPAVFGRPSHLVAAQQSKDSDRPVLTLKPLSDALHLPIDTRFEHDQFKDLAHELLGNPRYQGARIALCWHHGEIADLARALQAADAPDHWDPDVFDHIWQIDYGLDHPKLTKVHQKLLYGDSD
jgi:phage terminase large subunit-like protein